MSVTELVSTSNWTFEATPEQLFKALSEPEELKRWFADEVEVEPHEGGAFRFWGPHVYGTRTREAATQRLTRFEPGRTLAFTWELEGRPSEVTLDVEPADDGQAKLAVTHRFPEAPATGRAKHLVDDLWRVHWGNLYCHLKGGEGITRVDFADPRPQVRLSTVIEAPVERVFRAFTDPELLKKWVDAADPVVEPRAGGRYSYGWSYDVEGRKVAGGPTRILEIVENQKIVTDWPDWRGDPTIPDQKITWTFEDLGGKTRVNLLHDGFLRAVDQGDYPFGWLYFLGKLKDLAEAA
jgi:uncharacterized protein YndB with AHSA1/START domain